MEIARQHARLLEIRRHLFDGPKGDAELALNTKGFKDKLQRESEHIADILRSRGFAKEQYDPCHPIYGQSLWKYRQLAARLSQDGLSSDEARTLFDIADNSEELGIKYYFYCMAARSPFVFRHGGGRNTASNFAKGAFTTDFDLSYIYRSGGMNFINNLSDKPQQLYTAEPGAFGVSYDLLHGTRTEQPTPVAWDDEQTRLSMLDQSSSWSIPILNAQNRNARMIEDLRRRGISMDPDSISAAAHEAEYNVSFYKSVVDADEKAFFSSGLAKAEYFRNRLREFEENINIHQIVKLIIDDLFGLVFLPQSAQTLASTLKTIVIAADTIDQQNRRLYLFWIDSARRRTDFLFQKFQTDISSIQEDFIKGEKFRLEHIPLTPCPAFNNAPLSLVRSIALAASQDIVTISATWPRLSTIMERLASIPTRLVRNPSAITK